MTPANHNLVIYQGSTFTKLLKLSVGGSPLNITGYTFRMQVRESKIETSPVIIELTTENGRINVSGVSGEVTLLISATDTEALTFKSGFYDLEMVSGSVVNRILEGSITLSQEVTR